MSTSITSILGMLLGTAGFVLSLVNFLRDRSSVQVTLTWEMVDRRTGENVGLVRVTNVGRRPVFITIVALQLPKGLRTEHIILDDSLPGIRVGEGDKPAVYVVRYTDLGKNLQYRAAIRAYVEDSAGNSHISRLYREGRKLNLSQFNHERI